jgi:hypothetical protein
MSLSKQKSFKTQQASLSPGSLKRQQKFRDAYGGRCRTKRKRISKATRKSKRIRKATRKRISKATRNKTKKKEH